MALALRELQFDYDRKADDGHHDKPSLADFNYARKDMADQLMTKISSLRFHGASGLVSFSGADRIGTTALFQIQSKYIVHLKINPKRLGKYPTQFEDLDSIPSLTFLSFPLEIVSEMGDLISVGFTEVSILILFLYMT